MYVYIIHICICILALSLTHTHIYIYVKLKITQSEFGQCVPKRILDKLCSSFLVYDYGSNQTFQSKAGTGVSLPRTDLCHTLLPNMQIPMQMTHKDLGNLCGLQSFFLFLMDYTYSQLIILLNNSLQLESQNSVRLFFSVYCMKKLKGFLFIDGTVKLFDECIFNESKFFFFTVCAMQCKAKKA